MNALTAACMNALTTELLCRTDPRGSAGSAIISPPSTQHLLHNAKVPSKELTPHHIILPRVILWNPLVQIPLLSSILVQCPFEHCESSLVLHSWTMGQNNGRLPRLIHDTEGVALLVSALYKCSNGHLIYSTDPRLMKKISIPYLPFILLHRTGFTRSFITNVGSLVQQGLSMNCIARHIKNVREQAGSHKTIHLSVTNSVRMKRCNF